MEKRKGGRPRTGSVEVHKLPDGSWHYDIRVTLNDGTRSKPRCLPAGTSPEMARERAKAWAERVAAEGTVRDVVVASTLKRAGGELTRDYAGRWFAERERAGIGTVDDDRQRYRDHIDPAIGHLPIKLVSKADIVALVRRLDERVRDESVRFSWKTASNVWMVVSKMFGDACGSKRPDLVVREDDPTDKVAPPDRGEDLDRTYLYPSEMRQLLECPGVPVRRRRLYALAAYTLSRAGELRALQWPDVDLDRGIITLRQASDGRKVKRTKSGKTRRIPIEPALRPLLEALRDETGGQGKVVHVPVSKVAEKLQRDLRLAGLTRRELYPPPKDDPTVEGGWDALTFHDLRGTGVTWLALRGDEPLAIQRRAGHSNFSTTERYLREAETLGRDGGEPFPALPADLVSPDVSPDSDLSARNFGAGHGVRTHSEEPKTAPLAEIQGADTDADVPADETKCATAHAPTKPQTKPLTLAELRELRELTAAAKRWPLVGRLTECIDALEADAGADVIDLATARSRREPR